MNIRSITTFIEVSSPVNPASIGKAAESARALRDALGNAGITVQSMRFAIQPFPAAVDSPDRVLELAKDLQALAFVNEVDYISLGPVRLDDPSPYVELISTILQETENVFASVEIATPDGFDLSRIRRAAAIIRRVSALTPDGFANLRLAALANVRPWAPFFPAAYHGGGAPRIALAMECADLAVAAVSEATSLEDARSRLIQSIQSAAERIEGLASRLLRQSGVEWQGFDFSLAPYPEKARSVGTALERLGLSAAGIHGTLMTSAFLTDALDRVEFRRTGFCGLMLPVLEDSVLADRAAEGALRVTDLLTYSAVCGTGLDTIPLPGDVSEDTLAGILIDVAALALRLDKQLTARLMPMPGKQAGDPIEFDFEFFAGSRVMAPQTGTLSGLLRGDERVRLAPRPRRKLPGE